MDEYIETIREISDKASKEFKEEVRLADMKKIWDGLKLEFVEYKNTGTSVLRSPEAIFNELDDQIATTQAMKVAKHCTDQLKKEVI